MITVDEFEDAWRLLLEKYKLQNNAFLIQIYEVRYKWAKPYFSGKFCAKLTSTQRSESANHLLKGYIPPSCPMNLFVRQYSKIQFDREAEEGFQEQRSRLGGVVLRSNLPLEEHASKIYTRTMFEMFAQFIYRSVRYDVEPILPGRSYMVKHVNSEKREKWRRGAYKVDMSIGQDKYICECGLFEHMGMLCCHAIKVMLQLGVQEIPKYHILKRWTMDARDNLPPHLLHYQKDQGPRDGATFRHNALYLTALDFVQRGDRNVAAFDRAMDILIAGNADLDIVSAVKDGEGVADNLDVGAASGTAEGTSVGNKMQGAADCYSDNEQCPVSKACPAPSISTEHTQSDINAPDRKKRKGRDKPGYEITDKMSRFCTICQGKGHTSTTCPGCGDLPKKPRKEAKCGICGVAGHRRNNCIKPLAPDASGV